MNARVRSARARPASPDIEPQGFREIQIAFQPIVEVASGRVFAYEALVRGRNGEGARQVFSQVPAEHRAAFDHRAMLMALFTAAKLGLRSKLALNVAPSVVRHQGMLQSLRTAAATAGISPDRIILELSESEFADPGHAVACLQAYRAAGFLTALDDFGVGQTGLGILASVQPPLIKLDPHLVHGVADDAVRHAIIESIVALARRLGSLLVAEGVETAADARALRQLGINLQQGFFYAMPEIDVLPVPVPGTRP